MAETSSPLLKNAPIASIVLGIALLYWSSAFKFCFLLGTVLLLFGSYPYLNRFLFRKNGSRGFSSNFSKGSALSTTEFYSFKLIRKESVSHNTAIYRFELPSTQTLGLPIGQHISVRAMIGDKEHQRSYTPVTLSTQLGYFELMIKTYPQGIVSKMFSELKLGESVQIRGPKGQFKYTSNAYTALNMIAGGTGITPMYQLIQYVLITKHSEDRTQLNLIFANLTEQDILLKKELDLLTNQHPQQFRVKYVLNHPPEGWTGGTGYVTKEMMQEFFPPPSSASVKLLLCGPPPMIKAMAVNAEELGYEKAQTISKMTDQIFKF